MDESYEGFGYCAMHDAWCNDWYVMQGNQLQVIIIIMIIAIGLGCGM